MDKKEVNQEKSKKHKIVFVILAIIVIVAVLIVLIVVCNSKQKIKEIGANIGDYVNYTPEKGQYTVDGNISGYTEENGEKIDQVFETEEDMKWRIWSYDNDTITLISENETTISGINDDGTLYLEGAKGYNNGVYILNELCKACYGPKDEYKGIEARSINIEDLKNVVEGDWRKNNKSESDFAYGDSKKYKDCNNAPKILVDSENTFKKAEKNMSVQKEVYTDENGWAGKQGEKAEFYQTYWTNANMETENTSGERCIPWKDDIYSTLVSKYFSYFWVASRNVILNNVYCSFGVACVSDEVVNCITLADSDRRR